jgi:hypothetical protein
LIGEPGTGKSNAITDFLESIYSNTQDLVFSVQLNEFTKGADITGRPNIKVLSLHKEFIYDRPICKAKGIYIDEVGRGSSAIRNTLLSIMNEKKIISGNDSCNMDWELFVGSTNSIPTEETEDAFWDRFPIMYEVTSSSPEEMTKFILNPTNTSRDVCIPEQVDIDSISFNPIHIETFVKLVKRHKLLTDRTISKIIPIAKCIKVIWQYDTEEEALGKTASLICPSICDELMNTIISPQQRQLKDKLNLLKTTNNKKSRIPRIKDTIR